MADEAVKRIKEGAKRVENARLQKNQCQKDKKQLEAFKKKACTKKNRLGYCKEYEVTDEQELQLKALKGGNHGKTCNKTIKKKVDDILSKKKSPGIKF